MLEELKQQNEKLQMQLRGMQASISAHKQLLNEHLDNLTITRTNLISFQQAHKDVCGQLEQVKQQLDNANQAVIATNAEADLLRVELDKFKNPVSEISEIN